MKIKAIKAIITGSTGMVGEGVLRVCLNSDAVKNVLVINRKPCHVIHPKLKEIIREDFMDWTGIEDELEGYNACFFCLGVSSIRMPADRYYELTYTLTLKLAAVLSERNPDMTFCYISGAGTDSTEKGSSKWAKVKGKTENDLMKLPFGEVYAFRPGFIKPIEGLVHTQPFYKYIGWLFPVGRAVYPNGFCTLQEVGESMINAATWGYTKKILEGRDIIQLARLNAG
ncbi:NAD-dependent epimerase/dehydratase family protein [Pedobacter antarcticus]|uniref:NAD-dependent epimerase/dehydratase family protein n=1 Tax=Pedobacter antarcticus TaxID=34086 RepID=UPI0029308DD1|nr:NAD-dependent epimerase/dehydratase family protein [Pedobacter antarcticus]